MLSAAAAIRVVVNESQPPLARRKARVKRYRVRFYLDRGVSVCGITQWRFHYQTENRISSTARKRENSDYVNGTVHKNQNVTEHNLPRPVANA